jgi:hypothetical protein
MQGIRVLSVSLALAAGAFLANAQTFSKVDFHIPYTVNAGTRDLPPGDYEIRPITTTATYTGLFGLYKDGGTHLVTLMFVSREVKPESARGTKVLLAKDGREYSLAGMWIGTSPNEYDFSIRGSAKARSRERSTSKIELGAEAF